MNNFEKIQNDIIDIEEMISIAKHMGKNCIVLKNIEKELQEKLIDKGYIVYSCEKTRINGHLKFIHLTMIEWR